MQLPDPVLSAVTMFHAARRHPRLPPMEYSEVYSLFPQETLDTPTHANWPDTWPLADRPGVYLVFGAKKNAAAVRRQIGRNWSSAHELL